MEREYPQRDGLYVASQIPDCECPDIYVDCLLDKDDGGVRSAYGIVYQDFVIELYHLVKTEEPCMKSVYPEFELVHVDTNSGTKRFYKVVLDHEEMCFKGGQA